MLSLKNLKKTYANGVMALNDVSLDISRGMFGLLGPNGAGKSTLMRSIATLQDVDSGSITFDGVDVTTDKDALRKQLGYLPQDFGVYPRISAEDLLDHMAVLKGIANRKERKELVGALLHQTNLYDVRKKHIGGFSGGMRQRFGIAQALLGNPKLVIVDEPTAGLDPAERNRFHNLLVEIGQDVVVILSTHIVEDVTELCDDMAILASGTVRLRGKPLELISSLEGRIWKRFIERSELPTYQQQHDVISTRLVSGQQVIHVLADSQPGDGFENIEPDLEDVYFSNLPREARHA
ncbi:MAG: ABC transporter ATP-binding protein [Gammaproteobacteria bacterium]|nr:ABC transporter ATP-binding protein [Gammaproteobacteria bacterium]